MSKIDQNTKPLEELKKELTRLKIDLSLGKLKDTSSFKARRRELARVLTAIRQKEVVENA